MTYLVKVVESIPPGSTLSMKNHRALPKSAGVQVHGYGPGVGYDCSGRWFCNSAWFRWTGKRPVASQTWLLDL